MKWYHFLKFFLLLLAPIAFFITFKPEIIKLLGIYHDPLEQGAYLVTILGGYFAAFTLFAILWQIMDQNRQYKRARTYEFSEKFQRSEFYEHLSKTRKFLNDPFVNQDAKWSKYKNGQIPETAKHVYIALAYFEDLALMYNKKYINRNMIRRLLKSVIVGIYNESEWFRNKAREDNENAYKEWDKMYKNLTRWWQWFV